MDEKELDELSLGWDHMDGMVDATKVLCPEDLRNAIHLICHYYINEGIGYSRFMDILGALEDTKYRMYQDFT